jgi:hypothetical protein
MITSEVDMLLSAESGKGIEFVRTDTLTWQLSWSECFFDQKDSNQV